ncbi:hypothetical protein [Gymnodinialimonas sp.]
MAEDPVVKLLIVFLTTPSSNFYLSKLLGQSTSPKLEPLAAGNISLGSQPVAGIPFDMSLSNVVITGLSSIQVAKSGGAPEISVSGSRVAFTAEHPNTEAPPPGVPSQLTLEGNFKASGAGTKLDGTFKVTVADLTIKGAFDATSSNGQASGVVVDFKSLDLNVPATTQNVKITLGLNSNFTAFINEILNTPDIIAQIMGAVKSELSSPTILSGLSQAATQGARSALADSPLG